MNNKQDPRYFKYSPFEVRQGPVTGVTNYISTTGNTAGINASSTDPLVVTWANGFNPFQVDYAYSWSSSLTNLWTGFSAGTFYLFIDYDPSSESVSYGYTSISPTYSSTAPSHGAGVHWFDLTKQKMFESVASVWVERIRVFVGSVISTGATITSNTVIPLQNEWINKNFSTSSGYMRLKNGFILQWGMVTTGAGGNATFTFPVTFPSAAMSGMVTYQAGGLFGPITINLGTVTSSSAQVWSASSAGVAAPGAVIRVWVIGY